MLKNRYRQKFIAALFVAVYLFVALFAQRLHNHSGEEVFNDFHFTGTENIVSKTSLKAEVSGCLSCHILHDGKHMVSNIFTFTIVLPSHQQSDELLLVESSYSAVIPQLFLRGPPSHFI